MEILCYYDTRKNRKHEFRRLQVGRDGNTYVFEELICKKFGEETPCEEVDRQEFKTEPAARVVYESRLREI